MLTAVEIQDNWDEILHIITTNITGDRKDKLLDFYKKYEDILHIIPAANKLQYHNCFPGGYIDHVLRVTKAALKINEVWNSFGQKHNFSEEELIFSAINHDLGKMGDGENGACYVEQTDQWRRDKLDELYSFNTKISFMSVPDRSLRLLQKMGVEVSDNEWLAIKLHDGLYDEANKAYLFKFQPEQKLRTTLPLILHQADLMASRIEYDNHWWGKFNDHNDTKSTPLSKPVTPKPPQKKVVNENLPNDLTSTFSNFFNS